MQSLLINSRFYILLVSTVLALVIASIASVALEPRLALIRTQEIYSALSVILLFCALYITPVTKAFTLPFGEKLQFARRAIGVSAFGFGLLHAAITFYGQFGGFGSLAVLDNDYLNAFLLGVIALVILGLMALTSFDWAIKTMTFPWWKRLHRLVYIAGVAILLHIYLIGSHFADITSVPSILFLVALTALATLWAIGLDRKSTIRFGSYGQYVVTLGLTIGIFSMSLIVARLIEIDVITPLSSMHQGSES